MRSEGALGEGRGRDKGHHRDLPHGLGPAGPFWSPGVHELPSVTRRATPGRVAALDSRVTRVGPQRSAAEGPP